MNLDCRIVISRSEGHDGPVYRLSVEDVGSGVQFLSAGMTPDQFAAVVTARVTTCAVEVRGLDKVGMLTETKREALPAPDLPGGEQKNAEAAAALLAPFEVNGWVGRRSDLFNMHMRLPDGRQNVLFIRHVPREPAP